MEPREGQNKTDSLSRVPSLLQCCRVCVLGPAAASAVVRSGAGLCCNGDAQVPHITLVSGR